MPSKRPLYSKRHYEDVAFFLADWGSEVYHNYKARDVAWIVAHSLADHFAADNPQFDRARFLKAAGVEHA